MHVSNMKLTLAVLHWYIFFGYMRATKYNRDGCMFRTWNWLLPCYIKILTTFHKEQCHLACCTLVSASMDCVSTRLLARWTSRHSVNGYLLTLSCLRPTFRFYSVSHQTILLVKGRPVGRQKVKESRYIFHMLPYKFELAKWMPTFQILSISLASTMWAWYYCSWIVNWASLGVLFCSNCYCYYWVRPH